MTQILSAPGVTTNQARSQAGDFYAVNCEAIAKVQPEILPLLDPPPDNIEFLYGRDGSITAMLPGAKWWGNCSLPRRSAECMFKSLEIRGVLGCFLSPVHAAQIRAALDRLEPHQAVLALIPDQQALQTIMHCGDFAKDIASHRLWLAAGDDWRSILTHLFINNPGLPTPADFIRAISPDSSAADALIGPAQKVFADATTRRAAEIQCVTKRPMHRQSLTDFCVIAPSHFRLWNHVRR